jgi:hypothetical protein
MAKDSELEKRDEPGSMVTCGTAADGEQKQSEQGTKKK